MLSFLKSVDLGHKSVLGILTKLDLISEDEKSEVEKKIQALGVQHWVWTSSKTSEGIHLVAEQMVMLGSTHLARAPGEVLLTRIEHVEAVKSALLALAQANIAEDLALFAADIRHAMNELGPLIGETLPDDVLGKIFSDFCIGK